MEITTVELKEKINSGEKILIDFWGTFCGPCKVLKPMFESASEKLKEITLLGINQLENEVNDEKRLAFDDRSILDELRRNRDVLQKEINRAESNNKK